METYSEESLHHKTELYMDIHGEGPEPGPTSYRRVGPTTRRDVREYDVDDQKDVINDGGSGRYTLAYTTQCEKARRSCGPKPRVIGLMVIHFFNLFNIPIGLEHVLFHNRLWLIIKPKIKLKSVTRVMLVLSMFNYICSNIFSQIIIVFVCI